MEIMEVMIAPEVLREPLLEEIQKKKAANKLDDADYLTQALQELDKKPIDLEKFKSQLAKVAELWFFNAFWLLFTSPVKVVHARNDI